MKIKNRCLWPGEDPLMIKYHDEEWGRPQHDDRTLFEFMILESFQAGLSWRTVLHKRENFRQAFANFDAKKVSKFDRKKINSLMKDAGIIRNRLKIEAAINNASCFLKIQKEFGSFDRYVWGFVKHKAIINKIRSPKDYQARTKISDTMSEDMGLRGFKFRGSTICYAFMQAVGMVDDHMVGCHCKNRSDK